MDDRHFRLRAVITPLPASESTARDRTFDEGEGDAFRRPEGEDDDGYDPYSDRPAEGNSQWEEDPWD